MATISGFKEIQAWQTAREICRKVGKLIDEERFKKTFG